MLVVVAERCDFVVTDETNRLAAEDIILLLCYLFLLYISRPQDCLSLCFSLSTPAKAKTMAWLRLSEFLFCQVDEKVTALGEGEKHVGKIFAKAKGSEGCCYWSDGILAVREEVCSNILLDCILSYIHLRHIYDMHKIHLWPFLALEKEKK